MLLLVVLIGVKIKNNKWLRLKNYKLKLKSNIIIKSLKDSLNKSCPKVYQLSLTHHYHYDYHYLSRHDTTTTVVTMVAMIIMVVAEATMTTIMTVGGCGGGGGN